MNDHLTSNTDTVYGQTNVLNHKYYLSMCVAAPYIRGIVGKLIPTRRRTVQVKLHIPTRCTPEARFFHGVNKTWKSFPKEQLYSKRQSKTFSIVSF